MSRSRHNLLLYGMRILSPLGALFAAVLTIQNALTGNWIWFSISFVCIGVLSVLTAIQWLILKPLYRRKQL